MKWKFFILLLCLLLSACINDVRVKISRTVGTPTPNADPIPTVPTLNWNFSNLVILPGEEVPFQISNGVAPYIADANGVGTFDAGTLVYSTPVNQAPANHSIDLEDADAITGTNSFKISAFQVGSAIKYPLTFGENNYVTGATVTANGNMFISSIIGDSLGWERWVVFKSADLGATWSEVDQYVPYEVGKSLPVAMTSKNNDIYTCGYIYGDPIYTSVWIVRKSTNAGSAWTNVDEYHTNPGFSHNCYDITVDQTSGHLFASGYESNVLGQNAIIRESSDDGATWTTIKSEPNTTFFSIKVSPNGTLWAMAETGVLYKGTYALGVWNWSTAGTLASGADSNGFYVLRGKLTILDDNTAFYSYTNTAWQINKTIDGGNTWTSSYTGAAFSTGRDILEASNGDLIAVGKSAPSPFGLTLLKSSDMGANWSSAYNGSTPEKEGHVLVEANDDSLIAFGNFYGGPRQIVSVRSTDNGANWSTRPNIYFKQNLYTEYRDFEVDSNGTMWSTSWLYYIDNNFSLPWNVTKSTDGTNWTDADVITTAGTSWTAESVAIGPSNVIYVSGNKNDNEVVIRKTTNNGTTWTQVDSHTPAASTYVYGSQTAVLPNGDVFYGATATVGASSIGEIHRGATNGTVWSTLQTFPLQAGSTNFRLRGIEAFSDGSLWIYGSEVDVSSQPQIVVYSSTDNGVTFTEKYRDNVANVWGSFIYGIQRASNGDMFVSANNNILKSTDNGTTWNNFYLGTSLGNAKHFVLDEDDRIFITNSADQIITQNQFNNNFFITFDYSLLNNYYDREIIAIKRCGNLAPVCAIAKYKKSIDGTNHLLLPLTVP